MGIRKKSPGNWISKNSGNVVISNTSLAKQTSYLIYTLLFSFIQSIYCTNMRTFLNRNKTRFLFKKAFVIFFVGVLFYYKGMAL